VFPRILVTNGGPHEPESWAVATADMIFDTDGLQDGARRIAALEVKARLAKALTAHHAKVRDDERAALKSISEQRLTAPHVVEAYLDAAIADIVQAAQGSPWEGHWNKPETREAAKEVLRDHFTTAQHVERLWYSDPSPTAQEHRNRVFAGARPSSAYWQSFQGAR